MFSVNRGYFARKDMPRWTYDVDVLYEGKLITMVSFTHLQQEGQFWLQDSDAWDDAGFTHTEMQDIIRLARVFYAKTAFPSDD
jgi:hypothetical protein